jgi:hypothetical protein
MGGGDGRREVLAPRGTAGLLLVAGVAEQGRAGLGLPGRALGRDVGLRLVRPGGLPAGLLVEVESRGCLAVVGILEDGAAGVNASVGEHLAWVGEV